MGLTSPGVSTQEKDLTFNIQSITSNQTGYVGMFNWGPANKIVSITTDESEMAMRFGIPTPDVSQYFHIASNYLLYTRPLKIVRVVGTGALNALASDSIETASLVENEEVYEDAALTGISFMAKYPGEMGNSLKVSVADDSGFSGWTYEDEFTFAPQAGQMNMVVVDEDGVITGNVGSILERYELVTDVQGDKKADGTTAYIVEVLKNQSRWVYAVDTAEIDFTTTGVYEVSLSGGANDNVASNADFLSGYDLFNNKDTQEITRLITGIAPDEAKIRAIDITTSRGDSVAFTAPDLSTVYNNATVVEDLKTYFGTTINKPSSYHFITDNWKQVYDKYNDQSIWIPTDGDAAGLHALLFVQSEPWFSPAGFNRGQLKNVIKLAWNSDETQRDVLYKNSINSIVSFPSEGYVLWGDKTALMAPSAFNRINVRTLFIVIKKAISRSAKYQLFEINDNITRAIFKNATDQYLDNVKSRRGIYEKMVVADESNNTPQVIDSNEFVGDIYVKPAKTINNIKLNFIATATGVDFEEIQNA